MLENNEKLIVEVENSACIKSFEYYKASKILRVTFQHGGYFDYSDLEYDIVKRWMQADSKGKFYNKEIKNRR